MVTATILAMNTLPQVLLPLLVLYKTSCPLSLSLLHSRVVRVHPFDVCILSIILYIAHVTQICHSLFCIPLCITQKPMSSTGTKVNSDSDSDSESVDLSPSHFTCLFDKCILTLFHLPF